ncbi:tyrosinase family oxidase copper chaperone [Streptomyces sp. NPDC008150]|uniref:tyrosinase family oxidase copper chaperone n=1 Tax=Streptomyces sp. NPDC008150 TaxID=3364816 RepID=UPI0036EDE03E
MAFSVGGTPAETDTGARESPPGPHPAWDTAACTGGAPARPARRGVARGLLAAGLVAVLAPVAAAVRAAHRKQQQASGDEDFGPGNFEETYLGRRVRVAPAGSDGEAWHVTVDGRPLHLMRRADGTWLSMVDHYCSYPTPLAAARAAVDALGPHRNLLAEHGTYEGEGAHGDGAGAGSGGMRMGGHRGGVHA